MAGTQTATQKTDFYIDAKNCEKSAVKYFIEEHILLNLWICLQLFVQDCLRKSIFIWNLVQTP